MKKLINIIKTHKVLSSVIISVCAVGIVGGGFAFGIHKANIDNTKKALNFAKDGYVDEVELNQLGEDIVLGEEIVLDDGTVVVVTKDENGNYVTHTTGGDTPEPTPTPTPGHTHVWVAHYTSVHHVDSHKESWWHCKCGAEGKNGDGSHTAHQNTGCMQSYGNITKNIVDREWDEQVVDYYYCSECGARQ